MKTLTLSFPSSTQTSQAREVLRDLHIDHRITDESTSIRIAERHNPGWTLNESVCRILRFMMLTYGLRYMTVADDE